MGSDLFESFLKDRRKVVAAAAVIIAVAAFARLYHIGWSFSNNGIDEGIMLERALLVSRGYELYTELPCDQAPLAFLMGAGFDGDVVALRSLSVTMSILAILACMYSARRIQGDFAMLVTGALLALDFAFLRESRLFSLDGLSSYFLAFSLLAFLGYARDRNRVALAAAGAMVGLSTAVKLFGGLALVGVILFMVLELRRNRDGMPRLAADISILAVSAAAPLAVLMLMLGPSDMIQGMVFDQGGREFDAFLKLSLVAFFGVNPAYVLPLLRARAVWDTRPEMRLLLVLALAMLAGMIVQPLSFFHHMVVLSPVLSILAGCVVGGALLSKKGINRIETPSNSSKSDMSIFRAFAAVTTVSLVIGAGFAVYGLGNQAEPPSNYFVSYVEAYTDANDYVVTGEPLIAALAGRMVPPELVNMAYRVGDEVTEEEVTDAILEYDVRTVIVCHRLNEMPGLVPFLEERGFRIIAWLSQEDTAGVLDLFQEGDLDYRLYALE
ncbi:MAG: hypothetical protein A3K67_06610 [Euryarchaeota archaeon RBG_16_62_10]|nr:MAG: hypothetical protein A3K67_06610 [Euryarchaeota archaeon RBG_16_62_10]